MWKLIGQKEDKVIAYMTDNGFNFRIRYTQSPKGNEFVSEKRVIRIKPVANRSVEILVGLFKLPVA